MKKAAAALSLLLGIAVIVIGFVLDASRTLKNCLAAVGLVIVVVSGIELIGRLLGKRPAQDDNQPADAEKVLPEYARKRTYISRAEYNFLLLLREIAPDQYDVVPQVPLAAVIDKKTQNAYRNELFRIVDYLFVDKDSYEPLLLVELNDASHQKADRMERDRKVAEICERAGMPLIAFTTAESKDARLVRKTVLRNILRR